MNKTEKAKEQLQELREIVEGLEERAEQGSITDVRYQIVCKAHDAEKDPQLTWYVSEELRKEES